jgi:phenylacetate-CoA ligase
MSAIKHVYEQVATARRNLVATARGRQLRRLRYTRHTWDAFERLMESQYWSIKQFEDHQLERLRFIVEHAGRNSPYYKSRYKQLGVSSDDIRTLSDIQKLPIVAKEDFRQNNDRFVITSVARKNMLLLHTGGTTGTPLSAYHLHHNMQERFAMMERLYHWYTPYKWRKRASFTGRLIVHPENQHRPFHRVNPAIRQQLYSSHHLTLHNLDHYVNELAAFSPDQIDGIASPIFVIADHLIRSGQAGAVKPRVLIPTSETLWPSIRSRMESGFQCKAANQYGSQEGAPIAYECPEGGFHICPESGIFEVLRSDGTPCKAGELGRLAVTSFLSEGTPLIRYDIGDLAVLRAEPCPCGRQMPMLAEIVGRVDQMFFTHERGIVPRVDSAFKSMPGSIIATQVAQVAIDRFEVRIIPDIRSYRSEHGASLIEHLHEYLGNSVKIDLTTVGHIPRTAGGKMPAMVNECHDPQVRNAIADHWNIANVSGS